MMELSVINDSTIMPKVRTAPWIGIGASGAWHDWHEALDAACLDFTVHPQDLYWDRPDGFSLDDAINMTGYPCSMETVPMIANVKGDDNRVLGIVTPQYKIVQNREAFRLMEPITAAGGVITNAGMTEQGLCFMVARMQKQYINGDNYETNVMVTNSFNGAFPLAMIITPIRIICQNMYRQLMGNKDNIVCFRHQTNIMEKIDRAIDVAGYLGTYNSDFRAEIINFAMHPMTNSDYYKLLDKVFPYPKPGGPREQWSIERVNALRDEFGDRYYHAPDNDPHRGTVFGFVNAYYDYLSHADQTKRMPGSWEDKRLSRLVSGDAVKTSVIKEAKRLCR